MSQLREILQNTLLVKAFQVNDNKERLKDCHNPEEPKKTGGKMECDIMDGKVAKTEEI